MDIDDFFEQIINGYLLGDLKNMADLRQSGNVVGGGAGYPMVITILSGIELLGGLLHPGQYTDSPTKSEGYFNYYWSNYLTPVNQAYDTLGGLFYKLIRHGIAHTFITKMGITVSKGQDGGRWHLALDSVQNTLNVDCLTFYEDFKQSCQHVQQALTADVALKSHTQNNLDLLIAQSQQKSDNVFRSYFAANGIVATPSAMPAQATMPSGITGSTTVIPDNVRRDIASNSTNSSSITGDS